MTRKAIFEYAASDASERGAILPRAEPCRDGPGHASDDVLSIRGGYQVSTSSRIFGSVGTLAVGVLAAAGLFLTFNHFEIRRIVSTPPIVVMPMTPDHEEPEKPQPQDVPKKHEEKSVVTPRIPAPSSRSMIALPQVATVTLPSPNMAEAAPPSPKAAPLPPATAPAVPAAPPPPSNHGPDKWESRVLARLERFRRYPGDAERARQQGTAYVWFRIDRNGHILSSRLERSSGYAALDRAALETLEKANPLPKVPADRPEIVELVVPLEFSISR